MDHSGPCIYAGGKISGNFTQDHRELSHKKLQISVAASAKFPNHRSAGPKVLTGDPHAQRRQIATDGMEFGRRARAGRRGDPEPSGPARSSGDGQLDYLDPDLFGGDSPGTPEDRSPRAKSRGGTPRKAQVGSIADDFDEDTDDEGAAPPSRGLDAAGGWGDEGGGGGGRGGQTGRRPDPRGSPEADSSTRTKTTTHRRGSRGGGRRRARCPRRPGSARVASPRTSTTNPRRDPRSAACPGAKPGRWRRTIRT